MTNMKINRGVIINLKKEKEAILEGYEMQRQLVHKAERKYVKASNFHMANLARAKKNCLENEIAWYEGMITGYKVSLSLMK